MNGTRNRYHLGGIVMKNSIGLRSVLCILALLLASVAWCQNARSGDGTENTPAKTTNSGEAVLAMAGNGVGIALPTSRKTYPVLISDRTIQVPEMMVYIPAGSSKVGSGSNEETVTLDGYCLGKFSVTN